MKHHLYLHRHHSRVVQQGGFTLLELLVALGLVLVIVISVQRYIAGVTVDHEGITTRRDEATQTRIVLSNIQRDVAQAGYFPFSENIDASSVDVMPVGVFYSSDQLKVASYQPNTSARDCNNAHEEKHYNANAVNQGLFTKGWTYVENIYSIVDGSLACDGNGGDNGRPKVLDHIQEMVITNKSGGSPATTKNNFISVCIITSEESTSIGGAKTPYLCNGKTSVPNNTGKVYYKIQADMPVYASSFLAGQE